MIFFSMKENLAYLINHVAELELEIELRVLHLCFHLVFEGLDDVEHRAIFHEDGAIEA